MALLNRRLKDKDPELLPFLDDDDNDFDDEFDGEGEKVFQHHGITLWISDSLFMLVEHIQVFAVFLVMSERWSWPLDWIREMSFVLLFNFDIWEFWKINRGHYDGASDAFVPSRDMFSYRNYLMSWTLAIYVLFFCYIILYRYILHKRPLYLLLYLSRMKRIFAIAANLLCIPVGLVVVRLLHCRSQVSTTSSTTVLNVENSVECWSGSHLMYGLDSLGWFLLPPAILLLFAYPIYLWKVIKNEVFTHSSKQHEGYLQLKEAEYLKGLDIVWAVEQFFLFSSYRRPWVYYRSINHFLRLLLVLVFAVSLQYQIYPIAVLAATLFLLALAMIIVKPFRVNAFNIMKIVSLLCNSMNALIGLLLELRVESVILIYPYIKYTLICINSFALLAFVVFFSYLILHNYGVIKQQEPLWPALSKETHSKDLDPTTRHYLKAVFTGRQVLERALSTPPIFVHVHELERQIQIVNAYCREAEVLSDPTFNTLWDLLDELIEAHTVFNKKSLFSESNKSSVHETANQLMKIMPAFRKRLDKREYDFILMSPLKKRMLLKMYALGLFLNGRSTRVQENVTKKLTFDQSVVKQSNKSLQRYSIVSPTVSNSGSLSVPNTAATIDLHDSLTDLLQQADAVTAAGHNHNDPQVLVIDQEETLKTFHSSDMATGSATSIPGTVTYESETPVV